MSKTLLKKFKNFIFLEKLFIGGEKLVVGISGGADSVTLVRLLKLVQKKYNLTLQLVHINYHLRDRDSDDDVFFVKELAKKLDLNLVIIDYQKSDNHFKDKGNLEEKLRNFRYWEFERIRREKGFDWVVVAHHQDDQVETFLLNLFRGAGVDGLKGMLLKDEDRKILRPLLSFSKGEIIEFLQSIKQGWREDCSNQENTFLRNKIRNKLIPELELNYSANFKRRVAGAMRQLQACQKIIDKIIEEKFVDIVEFCDDVLISNNKQLKLNIDKFLQLNKEIQSLVFRKLIQAIKGDLRGITESNYQEFHKLITSTKGKNQKMKIGKIEFQRKGSELMIGVNIREWF